MWFISAYGGWVKEYRLWIHCDACTKLYFVVPSQIILSKIIIIEWSPHWLCQWNKQERLCRLTNVHSNFNLTHEIEIIVLNADNPVSRFSETNRDINQNTAMSIVICATCVNRELWKLLLLTVIPFKMMPDNDNRDHSLSIDGNLIFIQWNSKRESTMNREEKNHGIKRTRNTHENKRSQTKKAPAYQPSLLLRVLLFGSPASLHWMRCYAQTLERFFVFFIMNSNKWNKIINEARSVHAYAVYFYQFSQPMPIVLLNCVENACRTPPAWTRFWLLFFFSPLYSFLHY